MEDNKNTKTPEQLELCFEKPQPRLSPRGILAESLELIPLREHPEIGPEQQAAIDEFWARYD